MNRRSILGVAAAGLCAAVWTYACGDGATEPPTPPPDPPRPATVAVAPATVRLTALGATEQLTAEVRDQNGNVMTGAAVSWASSAASVATVSSTGLVTAVGNGTATITASAGGASGTATVTVAQSPDSVVVLPAEAAIAALGDTLRLVAEAFDANGRAVAGAAFSWESSDDAVATVDGSGLVTAAGNGTATITASAGGASGTATVTVAQSPDSVVVLPAEAAIAALGDTLRLVAEAFDANGRAVAGAAFSWESSDDAVATVDGSGLVTAAGNGTATITATAGEASGEAMVSVMQSAGSVVVSPAADTVELGDTVRLAAEAFDENGHRVEGAEFGWSSSDVSVATVDASGLVTGVAEGTATVTAAARDASGVAEITVQNPDRAALVALYEATGGPNWVNNDNWLTDAPLGDWYGVATDADGRVAVIDLGGSLDDESQQVIANRLTGTIPRELGNLSHLLRLNLSYNYLTGPIPPEMGKLANLQVLYLHVNGLTGEIPPELGQLEELTFLNLQRNRLTGEIPPELGNLAELGHLTLSGNHLTGEIPAELGQLENLTWLWLQENRLTGSIPKQLGGLRNLQRLNLSTNALTGDIPSELGRLTKLTNLGLARNALTGSVPGWLGNLTNLDYLNLQDNQLKGEIPSELGNLTKLTGLFLSRNHLTGRIPTELGNLENLRSLVFINNALVGPMPLSLMSLDLNTMGCFTGNPGLCAAGTGEFRRWLSQVTITGVQPSLDLFCDFIDRNALAQLYETSDGPAWSSSAGWLGETPLDEWTGVRTDSIGRVVEVDLGGNSLSGTLPSGLGHLSNMTRLNVADNALAGRLPEALMALSLEELDFSGTSLCVPDDPAFRAWLNDVPSVRGNTGNACAPLTERDILVSVFEGTGGAESWRRKENWVSDQPLGSWEGVETAADGSVVALDLCYNGMTGTIPSEIGELDGLATLRICGNRALSGPIPETIGKLTGLTSLDLRNNNLSGPIPETIGRLGELSHLNLSYNDLSDRIPDEIGRLQKLETLDLTWNELWGGIPASIGQLTNVRTIRLGWNVLTGIPGNIGSLANLGILDLESNPIAALPREIGHLKRLEELTLSGASLTRIPEEIRALESLRILELRSSPSLSGHVPPQIGELGNLEVLRLSDNSLTGPVPEAVGALSRLRILDLSGNGLTGAVPAQTGSGGSLEVLRLDDNDLSGGIPASLGMSPGLVALTAGRNPEMSGPLPLELTNLDELRLLRLGGTDLCTPPAPSFQHWLEGVDTAYVARCVELGAAAAYVMQAVQSFDHPTPLVAGDSAMVRVFLTTQSDEIVTMPSVRAVFHRGGQVVHTADRGPGQGSVPSSIDEGSLSGSQMIRVPGWVVGPGTEMVIEVDPDGDLDPGLDIQRRIPAAGRLSLDVRSVPAFDLTVVPLLWTDDPDYATAERAERMHRDDLILWKTKTLLPIEDAAMNVTVHSRVWMSVDPGFEQSGTVLREVKALRVAEGASGHWLGILRGIRGGRAEVPGWNSVSTLHEDVIAHELGHNMSLRHAQCDLPPWDPGDPSYPYPDGRIGAWGFDSRDGSLVPVVTPDLMGLCETQWIGDYHFRKTLNHRTSLGQATRMAAARTKTASLLLWGGVEQDTLLVLEPAFLVEAPPTLPDSTGPYTLTGEDGTGNVLFSLRFAMPELADADDGGKNFAFALPVHPQWEASLVRITLSGPEGMIEMGRDGDQAMALLLDERTGEMRGFLRDWREYQAAADGPQRGGGITIQMSRGIPSGAAWRR